MATTSIWADVVEQVTCGEVDVVSVIPAGGDPHSFEPSLADRAALSDAALVVANGLLLEEGLEDVLGAVADEGTPVFEIGDHIDTIAYASPDTHDDDGDDDHDDDGDDDHDDDGDDDHDDDGDDPHVWLDPARVADVLPELGEQLVIHAGLSSAAVQECVSDYQEQLLAVDDEISALVEDIAPANRKLVTNHDALGYFADRYDFELVGTVIPAPSGLAETNPAQLQALADLIETTGVQAIFADAQHSDDDAQALARQVGDVQVVTLYTGALDGSGESNAGSYLDLLRTNAELIIGALS